jgi:hypothetical protein
MTDSRQIFDDTTSARTEFIGRDWIIEAFDSWVADQKAEPLFLLTGEPGIGKSAFAAHLQRVRKFDAVHFCASRSAKTIDPLYFVRSISRQLSLITEFSQALLREEGIHVSIQQDIQVNYGQAIAIKIENLLVGAESPFDAFNRALLDPLAELYAGGYERRLLLLVDALDEAAQRASGVIDLLASFGDLQCHLGLFLTARPDSVALRQLRGVPSRQLTIKANNPANLKDIRAYITSSKPLFARLLREKINVAQLIKRVVAASAGNFLYLVWLIPALENGTHRLDDLNSLPLGLDGIYREFLLTRKIGENLSEWRRFYRPLLGILAVARDALSFQQLVNFVSAEEQDVFDCLLDVEQFLDPDIVPNGQYRLFHQSVSDFLCSKDKAREFWIDPICAHGAIAHAYRGTSPHWSQVNWESRDQYGLLHIAVHLGKAGRKDDLRSLLLDYAYLRGKLEAAGIAGLLSDLDMLPQDLAVARIASALRASAHALARDSKQLTAQLIGRIASGAPELDSLLAMARAAAPGCLLPLWPTLAAPGAVALWASPIHSGVVTCLAVLSSGGIVSGGQDGRLLLWNAVAGVAPPRLIGEHKDGVRCLAVLPDDRIISGGDDGRILLWDSAESGVPVRLGRHEHIVLAITVLPNGRIVSGGADCRVILWEKVVEASRSRELGRQDGAVNCLATLADGQVVSGGAGVQVRPGIWMGQLCLWDPNGGGAPLRLGQITREVTCVATLPHGGVVSGDLGGELRVWISAHDASDQTVGFKLLGRQDGKVRCVGVLPDGCIVSGGEGLRAERPG